MQVALRDGWYPRLQYPYLLCGHAATSLVDARDGRVIRTYPGLWPAGWIDKARAAITYETRKDVRRATTMYLDGSHDPWGPEFSCGGPVHAWAGRLVFGGHAAYTPQTVGVWVGSPDGTDWRCLTPGVSCIGASLRVQHGRLAAHMHLDPQDDRPETYQWWIFDASGERIAVLPTANLCIPGPGLVHGRGYYGPAILSQQGGPDFDVTVTPWRRESVPVIAGWVVTATAEDEIPFHSVIVRPLLDPEEVVQLDGFEAAYLDAELLDDSDAILIAGNNTRGQLRLETVRLDAPRAPFVGPSVPPPPPTDDRRDILPAFVGAPWDHPSKSVGEFYDQTTGALLRVEQSESCMGMAGDFIWWTKGRHGTVGWPGEVYRVCKDGWLRHCQDTIFDEPSADNPNGRGTAYRLRTNPHDHEGAKWLPLRAKAGDVVEAPNGQISWLKGGKWGPWEPFPYRVTVERYDGLDLVFTYEALLGDAKEKYRGETGNGLREWWWITAQGVVRQHAHWYERGGQMAWPHPTMFAFQESVPAPPVAVPVKATIVEPSVWPVRVPVGTKVRCVAQTTEGAADQYQWLLNGAVVAANPATDNDHTYRDLPVGTHQIGLRTIGVDFSVNETAMRREVVVTPVIDPPPPPPPPGGWFPTLAQIREWDANFLCFEPEEGNDEFHYAMMYLAWDDAKQARFRAKYGGRHTHLPLSVWAKYPGHGEYLVPQDDEVALRAAFNAAFDDLEWALGQARFNAQLNSTIRDQHGHQVSNKVVSEHDDPAVILARQRISALVGLAGGRYRGDMHAFAAKLRELLDAKIIPVVKIITDNYDGSPVTLDDAKAMVDKLATIKDVIPAVSLGWEINQIDGGWGQGAQQLALAEYVAEKLPDAVRYVHFSPERTSGYPNYPNHDGPQDEAQYYREAKCLDSVPWRERRIHGILYQRPPDEPITFVKAHTVGGPSQDGTTDIGDFNRLRSGGTWRISADFVLFEHSRQIRRHREVVREVSGYGLQGTA